MRQHTLELRFSLQIASLPRHFFFYYSMCCKCQVFTNVARMQTQQSIIIFSYSRCFIKQATGSDNCMVYEWGYNLTSVPKVRHVSHPIILIFHVWYQIWYCNAAECRIICHIRINSGPENSTATWVQHSTLANLSSWEIKLSFLRFCPCLPSFCSNRCRKHLLCFHDHSENHRKVCMAKRVLLMSQA